MTVGPGRPCADCGGDVGVKWNLILILRWKFILLYFWNWELKIDFWVECEILIFVLGLWVMTTWIDNMDLSFVVLVWTTIVWYDKRRYAIPFTEQRAWGLLRILAYSVSRYWCIGIRGFHMERWGCFWLVYLVSSGGAQCFTSATSTSSFVLYLFGTT